MAPCWSGPGRRPRPPQGRSAEGRAAGPRGPGCGPRRVVTGFCPHRPREAGDSLRHLPEGGYQNRQPGEAQRVCADEGEWGVGPGGRGRGEGGLGVLGCREACPGAPCAAMAQSPAPELVRAPASARSLAQSGPVPSAGPASPVRIRATSASEEEEEPTGTGDSRVADGGLGSGPPTHTRVWGRPLQAGRGSPSSSRTPSRCCRAAFSLCPLVNSLPLPGPALVCSHPGLDREQACPAGHVGARRQKAVTCALLGRVRANDISEDPSGRWGQARLGNP